MLPLAYVRYQTEAFIASQYKLARHLAGIKIKIANLLAHDPKTVFVCVNWPVLNCHLSSGEVRVQELDQPLRTFVNTGEKPQPTFVAKIMDRTRVQERCRWIPKRLYGALESITLHWLPIP